MIDSPESRLDSRGNHMAKAAKRSYRTVIAPAPSPATTNLLPGQVLSAILAADEDVEWTWTSSADRVSYVSGYTVVKRENRGPEPKPKKVRAKA
jgi:hypothetical protein